jgi:Flp pilus assembly protein TadB
MAAMLMFAAMLGLVWPAASPEPLVLQPGPGARMRHASIGGTLWFGTVPVGLLLVLADPLSGIVTATGGPIVWWWQRRRHTEGLKRARREAAPETLDLLSIAVGSGLTVPGAMQLVIDAGPAAVTEAFRAVLARSASGQPLARALPGLSDDLGDAYHPMVMALIASVRDGAPLGQLLMRLGDNARLSRRRRAEERAGRLPVAMMFPLAVCSMPAVLVGTVVPLVVVGLRSTTF